MEIIGEPMNHNKTKLARVVLSQEEIAWLFGQVGVEIPAGISMPLEHEEKGLSSLLLDAAQRALIARGLVHYDAKVESQIDRGLLAITSIITNPSQIVVLAKQEKVNPLEQHYFYRVPEIGVAYNLFMPGLYEFDVTTEVDMGKSLANEWLSRCPNRVRESASYAIAKDDIIKVQQMASEAQDEAGSHLISVGVSRDDAHSFVTSLAEPSFSLVVQIIYKPGFRSEQRLTVLTTGLDGHWLVDSDGPQSEMVQLRCLTNDQLRWAIEEIYNTLLIHSSEISAKE